MSMLFIGLVGRYGNDGEIMQLEEAVYIFSNMWLAGDGDWTTK